MAAKGRSGGQTAVFFKDTKTWGNKWHNQKDFTQLSLKLRELSTQNKIAGMSCDESPHSLPPFVEKLLDAG